MADLKVPAYRDVEGPSDDLNPTALIVAAYVAKNSIAASGLPDLIREVHAALSKLATPVEPEAQPLVPAIAVRRSVTPDHIVCLEDGLKFRSLKRHLQTEHGLTAQQYREKWGLRPGYPMVAPNYSAARSEMAKAIGLGKKNAPKENARGRRKATSTAE